MSAPGGNQQFQPESLSELARFVQYMFSGFEKQLNQLSDKLDQMDSVSHERHREDMERLRGEIKDLEADIEKQRARQTAQTRWVIGSILFPLVGLILTAYSLLQGAA